MGTITETATSAPGYNVHPPEVDRTAGRDPQAERLLDGPVRQVPRGARLEDQPVGPFDLWPTGSGFDYFYGFIGGETNQYYPALYEGTTPIEPPRRRLRATT